jgi:hypothetical protein
VPRWTLLVDGKHARLLLSLFLFALVVPSGTSSGATGSGFFVSDSVVSDSHS